MVQWMGEASSQYVPTLLHCSYQYPTLWYSTEQQKMLLPFQRRDHGTIFTICTPHWWEEEDGMSFHRPSLLVDRAIFCSIGFWCSPLLNSTMDHSLDERLHDSDKHVSLMSAEVRLGLFQNNQCKEYVHNRPRQQCSTGALLDLCIRRLIKIGAASNTCNRIRLLLPLPSTAATRQGCHAL